MSTDLNASFNEQYMNINTKMKKWIPKNIMKTKKAKRKTKTEKTRMKLFDSDEAADENDKVMDENLLKKGDKFDSFEKLEKKVKDFEEKERFMRKPNISEATNEFLALAIQCEHSDQPAFAGHSYVGAAKCEASIGNFLGEAEHYLAAARQFIKAEKKLKSLKFFSADRENLEAATGCYIQAFNKYPESSPLRTSVLMELANNLVDLNHKLEAASYYEQAIETVTEPTMKVMCYWTLLNLMIDCGKYDIALEVANKICDCNLNVAETILAETQVSRILLTLLLKPPEDNKPSSLKKLFIDLMNDTQSDAIPLSTDIILRLQSIIICSTTGDLHSLISVAADTKQFLTLQQVELLHKLISEHKLG